MAADPEYKYAVLLAGVDFPPGAHTLDSRTHAANGSIETIIEEEHVRHWKDWTGALAWDEVVRSQGHILTWVDTDRPEVLDADNERAKQRLTRCWYAFQLCGARTTWFGQMRQLTGRARRASSGELTLVDLRGISALRDLRRAFYMTRKEFWEARRGTKVDDWWSRFVSVEKLLGTHGGIPKLPALLEMALVSFSQGQQNSLLDFSVPNYIRAAESIVGLPRGPGKQRFAQRCRAIVTGLASDAFLQWGVSQVDGALQDLYQLRSDCVHGKAPFHDLRTKGDVGELESAKLEYVAEMVARELILWALQHVRRDAIFADRATLELEWATTCPPT